MSEITSAEIFTFVTETLNDEYGSLELRTMFEVIMETSQGKVEPKDMIRQFSVVTDLYKKFCLDQIARLMSDKHSKAVSQLHDASIVAQGGT